jgi:hypothetical protein
MMNAVARLKTVVTGIVNTIGCSEALHTLAAMVGIMAGSASGIKINAEAMQAPAMRAGACSG